ncbi:hypothetical protein SAMN05660916_02951 [Arthrobacter sp. 31Cvi3.1E]|nr:hypothetical protein SAMN05660916_02951 [Arthrobacter sp. 31Cvi3.1E]
MAFRSYPISSKKIGIEFEAEVDVEVDIEYERETESYFSEHRQRRTEWSLLDDFTTVPASLRAQLEFEEAKGNGHP